MISADGGVEPGERSGLDWSIRVVRQAVVETSSDFVGGTLRHSNEGMLDIPSVFVLLSARVDGVVRHYLVDSGVGPEPRVGGRPRPRHWVSPGQFLSGVGIDPAALEWLLLTHLHRDHTGNLHDFPRTRIGVQRREVDGWEEALALPDDYLPFGEASWAHRAISRETVHTVRGRSADGTCVLFDGDRQVAPGLAVVLAKDSHTFGSQLVVATTPEGQYVVCGDNVFCYDNAREMWPANAGQGNQFNVLKAIAWVTAAVDGQLDRIVPGHDMAVFAPEKTSSVDATPVAEMRVGSWDHSWRNHGALHADPTPGRTL